MPKRSRIASHLLLKNMRDTSIRSGRACAEQLSAQDPTRARPNARSPFTENGALNRAQGDGSSTHGIGQQRTLR